MDRSQQPLDFAMKSRTRTIKDSTSAQDDLLGGEPLEGSGFDNETPDPNFEFDRTTNTQGGNK